MRLYSRKGDDRRQQAPRTVSPPVASETLVVSQDCLRGAFLIHIHIIFRGRLRQSFDREIDALA
jgi:hypothetical protein